MAGVKGKSGVYTRSEAVKKMLRERLLSLPHHTGPIHSEEQKKKWSLMRRGIKRSDEDKKKISVGQKGKKHTEIWKQHIKESNRKSGVLWNKGHIPWNRGKIGFLAKEKHYNWKGGTRKERKVAMQRYDYILWRTSIFMRDNYICQHCGQHGGELQADHIKPWSIYPELRYAIDNGRTLCVACHRKTETWGGKIFKVERVNG